MNDTIIFTADNHLRDTQFARRDRAQDFQNALKEVVRHAVEKKAKAICVSGDILDAVRPSPATIRFLFSINAWLEAENIPMYVITGDHDKTDPHWTTLLKEDNEPSHNTSGIILLDNQLVTIPGTSLTIYGLSFIGKTKEPFEKLWDTLPKADILLAHTTIQEFCRFPSENALKIDDLPLCKFKVISIGDIHIHECRSLADDTAVLSPGSTEMCKTNEPIEKAVFSVEFPSVPFDYSPGNLTITSLPIKTRKVLRYAALTEEALQEALIDLGKYVADNPLVVYTYNPAVENVVERFGAIIDSDKGILRGKPVFGDMATGCEVEEVEDDKKLEDFLPTFIPNASSLFALAESLLSAEAPANDLLDAFITARMERIEAA